MKFVKKGQGTPRPATGHVGEWGMMVVEPGKDSQKLGMLVSHFLPDGAFPMAETKVEMIYLGISGKVQVKGKKSGEDWVIEAGDLVYIGPGDSREIKVLGTDPASIYVIMVRG
jgi:mannose-6-phosphate isomerase-like protein (cupin superfamily)